VNARGILQCDGISWSNVVLLFDWMVRLKRTDISELSVFKDQKVMLISKSREFFDYAPVEILKYIDVSLETQASRKFINS
jgi:hypothetical protein